MLRVNKHEKRDWIKFVSENLLLLLFAGSFFFNIQPSWLFYLEHSVLGLIGFSVLIVLEIVTFICALLDYKNSKSKTPQELIALITGGLKCFLILGAVLFAIASKFIPLLGFAIAPVCLFTLGVLTQAVTQGFILYRTMKIDKAKALMAAVKMSAACLIGLSIMTLMVFPLVFSVPIALTICAATLGVAVSLASISTLIYRRIKELTKKEKGNADPAKDLVLDKAEYDQIIKKLYSTATILKKHGWKGNAKSERVKEAILPIENAVCNKEGLVKITAAHYTSLKNALNWHRFFPAVQKNRKATHSWSRICEQHPAMSPQKY